MANLECVYSETSRPFERHFHNAYELLYVVSGRMEIQIMERQYIVEPHTLVFISKLEEHSVRVLDGNYRRYYLLIPPDTLPQLVPEARLRGVFVNRPVDFCHLLLCGECVAAAGAGGIQAPALWRVVHFFFTGANTDPLLS